MSAAPRRSTRGRRRHLAVRGVLIGAVAALATGCGLGFDPGRAPAPSAEEAAIREVFAPLGVADKAVAVAYCESGLNPAADSGTYKGLFQLGPHLAGTVDFYGGNWFDPLTNAQVARDLYLQSGWAPWPVCGRR